MPIFGKPVTDRVSQLKPSFVDRIRAGSVVPVVNYIPPGPWGLPLAGTRAQSHP